MTEDNTNNIAKLLVQVSLTEMDLPTCANRLRRSLQGIHRALASRVTILVVYQTKAAGPPPSRFEDIPGIEIEKTAVFSAAAARNRGLERARQLDYQYIMFHDASIFYTPAFLAMLQQAMGDHLDIALGKVAWGEPAPFPPAPTVGHQDPGAPRRIRHSPLRHTFIWAYLFKTASLAGLRFNEKIGPGAHSVVNAGEDTLFLCELAEKKRETPLCFFPQAVVLHPPRPKDLSKHLQYARAQGIFFRFALQQRFRPAWYFYLYLALFYTIFTLRILGMRRNAQAAIRAFTAGLLDQANHREMMKHDDSPQQP